MIHERKYIALIGDGMADEPIDSLGGKTPLEYANTPHLDFLASKGVFGLVRTVPEGMPPGSDTANLSVFGYDPRQAYTGRAPLEALNMGIEMGPRDAAFRCNMITLDNQVMGDFTADHIETEFSALVISELSKAVQKKGIEFVAGVSYRNIMMWRDFPYGQIPVTVPPHDITGKQYASYLPQGDGASLLKDIMSFADEIIATSDTIKAAKEKFHGNPTSIWLWGGGFRPNIEPVSSRFGLRGYTISAVDLIHGIGRAAGLSPCRVEGVTGYLDTNYEGKAKAAIELLSNDANFVFVHVEAPDEAGHEGNIEHKLKAIEDFDKRVVGPIIEQSRGFDDCTILCMPDHPTPIRLRTHSPDPVPFAIYREKGFSAVQKLKAAAYSEREAAKTGLYVEQGFTLMESMVKGNIG